MLEMIVAIALSALIAAMAFQSFDSASRNAQRTKELLNTVNRLDKAWQLIGQDIRNIVPVNVQVASQQVRFEASSLKTKGTDSFQLIMVFARHGWANPLGRLRSDLQQVNYRIAEGRLWRDYLPERNLPLENIDFSRDALHQLLLGPELGSDPDDGQQQAKVTDIQLRFLSLSRIKSGGNSVLDSNEYSREWDDTWPPMGSSGAAGMPVAVEISIELEGGERSVRLFEIPQK